MLAPFRLEHNILQQHVSSALDANPCMLHHTIQKDNIISVLSVNISLPSWNSGMGFCNVEE
jgi:hypothetical protein